jgi:hypothetical protein
MYVCFLLNNTWCEAIDDIPIRMSTGSTNDISPLLCFQFWEPVYYKLDDSDFPSDSREKCGHFVGISESVGHAMTFKILTDETLKVIHRSISWRFKPTREAIMETISDNPNLKISITQKGQPPKTLNESK